MAVKLLDKQVEEERKKKYEAKAREETTKIEMTKMMLQ